MKNLKTNVVVSQYNFLALLSIFLLVSKEIYMYNTLKNKCLKINTNVYEAFHAYLTRG